MAVSKNETQLPLEQYIADSMVTYPATNDAYVTQIYGLKPNRKYCLLYKDRNIGCIMECYTTDANGHTTVGATNRFVNDTVIVCLLFPE